MLSLFLEIMRAPSGCPTTVSPSSYDDGDDGVNGDVYSMTVFVTYSNVSFTSYHLHLCYVAMHC